MLGAGDSKAIQSSAGLRRPRERGDPAAGRKYQLQLEDANKETLRQKIVELETVLAGINGKVEEYEDALVRKLIERITIYDDYFTVEFKSGIEIDVRL